MITSKQVADIMNEITESFIVDPAVKYADNKVIFSEESKIYFGDSFFNIVYGYMAVFFNNPHITITSAHDGSHSMNSTHYTGKAIDLRINDLVVKYLDLEIGSTGWPDAVCNCFYTIARYMPEYVFIVHPYTNYHVHIQHGRDNLKNPMNGSGREKNFFISNK